MRLRTRKKRHPKSAFEGLKFKAFFDGTASWARCQRCFVTMPGLSWPSHGSTATNPCTPIWERRAA